MHIIQGKVLQGQGRGKQLGYPTANVPIKEEIPQGIYISETTFENVKYKSATFIGNAKTFNQEEVYSETFLINFAGDLYNKEISVLLIKKIRENEKFDTVEELIEQISKDVKETEEYFKNV